LYHPPKPKYKDQELIDFLSNLADTFLEENPDSTIICGGDLNKLDILQLSSSTGLTALVKFPTRKQAILDQCLTNCPSLFGKCFPVDMIIKTDHKGVVLPAAIKLKPFRYKYYLRDKRAHRQLQFEHKITSFD